MKTLSIYAVVATLAFGQINAAALPSDDSDFHVVKDTELGPIYSNVSPKDRRDDSKWYLVRNDADHPVYSSVDPAQVSKRDRPHGGPPQSGPGGPGGRPDWTNSHHPQDTGSNNNNNNNNNNNKNDGNSSSTSSNDNGGTDATKTDTDTTTTDTDTDTSKRDEAYTPAPQSEVEGWIKDHPVGKRDLVERGEIEKRTYKQCVSRLLYRAQNFLSQTGANA
ncbi:MAG: hypothetical protein M1812_003602 [Candelaria pacifica]|nr:MAG: hypothetical protein M1812_003602 [Candelaria pacifica]